MANLTIQVTDQHGGHIDFNKCIVTGCINIDIMDGQTGQTKSMLVDPKDPKVMSFLKETLQPMQLEMLLD